MVQIIVTPIKTEISVSGQAKLISNIMATTTAVEIAETIKEGVMVGPRTRGGVKVIERSYSSSPVYITTKQESEYTDEQFHADLKKASKRLDSMAEQALKEDAEGKTRKFPM